MGTTGATMRAMPCVDQRVSNGDDVEAQIAWEEKERGTTKSENESPDCFSSLSLFFNPNFEKMSRRLKRS